MSQLFDESAHPRQIDGRWATKRLGETDPGLGLSGREVLETVDKLAGRFARRHGSDPGEIGGQVFEEYYGLIAAASERDGVPVNGLTESRDRERAYLYTLTKNLSARSVSGFQRGEDFKAHRKFEAALTDATQQAGRVLSEGEVSKLADEVRMSFEPGRRPKHDFWVKKNHKEFSLDASQRDLIDPSTDRAEQSALESSATSHMDQALDMIDEREDRPGPSSREERVIAWAAIAESVDGPPVRESSLSEKKAAESRRLVRKSDGPRRLAAAWRKEVISPEQEKSLFAPFGDIGFEDKSRVCSTIERAGVYGDELWDAAMTGATRQRARTAA